MFFLLFNSILFFKASQNPMTIILPFIAVLVLVLIVTLYQRKKARERLMIMQSAAAQLGWTFSAEVPWNYIPGLDRFTLFTQGHSKQIKNMMYGEAKGVKAAVFDYNYTTGSGKNSATFINPWCISNRRTSTCPIFLYATKTSCRNFCRCLVIRISILVSDPIFHNSICCAVRTSRRFAGLLTIECSPSTKIIPARAPTAEAINFFCFARVTDFNRRRFRGT